VRVRGVRSLLAVLAMLTVGAGVAGCPSGEDPVPAGQLRIATGSPGGVYYIYGRGIAEAVRHRIPELRPTVLETAASAQNLRMVAAGEAEIGFTQADTAADVVAGGARVVALARLYDDYLHLVVRQDGPITKLADLAGKRVSIGARESGTVVTTRRLLGLPTIGLASATQEQLLGLDDSAAALEAGTIDAFFFSGGLPVGRVRELSTRLALRLVPLGQYASQLRAGFGQYYAEHTVPESTYGLPPVSTIGIPNYLVVSADLPEQTGYALTRTLFDEQAELEKAHPVAARLNPREAIYTHPLALHAGARRYFREIKP
jgi:uncharacterized protein